MPIVVAAFIILASFAVYEALKAARSSDQNQVLQAQLLPAQEQIDRLQHEHDAMDLRLASQANEMTALAGDRRELVKLNQDIEKMQKVAGFNDTAKAAVTNESDRLQEEAINVMKRASINWFIDGQLLKLKRRLSLTPDQEIAMRGVLEKLHDPDKRAESKADAKKHYQSDIASFLSPDQLSIASQMEKDAKVKEDQRDASQAAQFETEFLENLDLTSNQLTAVSAAMLQCQMNIAAAKSTAANLKPDGNLTSDAYDIIRNQKFSALKDLLTDEQFAIYKKYDDEETRELELFEAAEKAEKPNKP